MAYKENPIKKMESNAQERSNLLNISPLSKHMSTPFQMGGSSSILMGHSPNEMKGSPNHQEKDPVDGDVVPNYDTTNTVNRPNTTPTSSTSGTTTRTVYTPPERTAEGDAAYAALTAEQRKAQDDKYRRMNTKTVEVPASSENAPASSSSSTTTTNTKIGNLTKNSVDKEGKEALKNARSKRMAEKAAQILAAKKDSLQRSNRLYKGATNDGKKPLSQRDALIITADANSQARRRLRGSVSRAEAYDMFPSYKGGQQGQNPGTEGGVFGEEDLN
jgi:hypothetical protein